MRFTVAAEGGTDVVLQLGGGEQLRRLCHPLLAMQPFGLDWVEPGAPDGQGADEQAHAVARLLDPPVVRAARSARSGYRARRRCPRPAARRACRAPARTAHHAKKSIVTVLTGRLSTKRSHISSSMGAVPAAGQEAVAGQRLGVGVVARERLLD